MRRVAVTALLVLLPSAAHAQTLTTVRLAGGEVAGEASRSSTSASPSPRRPRSCGTSGAPLATLGGVERTIRGLRATITASAMLAEIAARERNEAFETEEFWAGMPLGTLTVNGRLRG